MLNNKEKIPVPLAINLAIKIKRLRGEEIKY
jgi:hypothetical protein